MLQGETEAPAPTSGDVRLAPMRLFCFNFSSRRLRHSQGANMYACIADPHTAIQCGQ